ncbi:MAG: Gfo/Idh/MocA family oxidoreductase, partial [Bryobacteraceae bacterium]
MPELLTRRRVLQSSAMAMTAASYSRILGANESVRLGVIGCGGRGKYDMQKFLHNPEVRVTAVCDVWGDRTDEAAEKCNNSGVQKFGDHRQLLERAETDAILITTPDHWHVPIALDAVDAGKDVYCEKPLTLKIEEGPVIV